MDDERLIGPRGAGIGHAAISKIGQHGLGVSRANYELWLTYMLGSSPELSRVLQELVAASKPPTPLQFQEVYDRFFARKSVAADAIDAGSRIALEVADALDALKRAGATTERYGETLTAAVGSLTSGTVDGDAVKHLINVLASATTEMSQQNASLSAKLAQSSQATEKLRTSLRQARSEALTDALTGVANRKLFDERLSEARAEAEREGTALCLVMCDIDHFKAVNDTLGHQTGDQVIRFVAAALTKYAKANHLVARYGGEEFAIIMPSATLQEAERIADQMRMAIGAKILRRRATNETIGAVTASFGVALYQKGESVTPLIARADACLYASKHTGRNRVTLETALRSDAAPPANRGNEP